jgi:proteasome beta subunit
MVQLNCRGSGFMMNEEISKYMLKSNTSLVGIVCKDGVILGADRRATAGTIVMNKDSKKIHKVTDFLATAYTGGVADIQLTNKIIAAELKLKELRTKSRASVGEAANFLAMMIYRNIRTPSMIPSIVGTLIAGVNEDGTTELYTIEPAGGVEKVKDFDANFSSGMPYILGLLERQWSKDISVEEGVKFAIEALKSSTQRDVGSGNGIDVFTITKDGINHVVSQEISPTYI